MGYNIEDIDPESSNDGSSKSNKHCHIKSGQIIEPEKTVPLLFETEVLVIGGGPAGLSAALAASRAGAKTAIVERYGFFGGVITQCQIGSISWYRHENTIESNPILKEFEDIAREMNAVIDIFDIVEGTTLVHLLEKMGHAKNGVSNFDIIDTELFKHVADMMLLDSGIQPVLHCSAVDVIMDGNTIKGVITESKSGRKAILASRVIDATGDADIAARAGAPFRKSQIKDLETATTNFGCSGVNLVNFCAYIIWQECKMKERAVTTGKEDEMFSTHCIKPFIEAKEAGEFPAYADIRAFPGSFTSRGEILSLNAVHLHNIDPLDVMSLTNGEIEGRKQVMWALEVLKKYVPGFNTSRLINLSSLGIRESRKIIGEKTITEHQIRNQGPTDDSIGICPEFIYGYEQLALPTTGRYFQVPYGIILPRNVENLLVAGKCVSGDRMSHAATRQMVCCTITGQGAGVASAVSLEENKTCRDVSIPKVQKELNKQGVQIR